jgi:hypothetical protein
MPAYKDSGYEMFGYLKHWTASKAVLEVVCMCRNSTACRLIPAAGGGVEEDSLLNRLG